MVDISSKGMALLYHADDNCPQPDQFITTNFGVPFFDSEDSFDTVFFNRIGRVCRVDKLTSKVNRIAVQFAEPLFFKPGEQNITDSDIKKRLEAKAMSIAGGKEKPVPSAISGQAMSGAEGTVTRKQTKAKIAKTKSYAGQTERAYSEALARAEETIRSYAEAKARAEKKAKAETKARARAETKAKSEAMLRAKAEKKAKAEAEKRAKIEAELQEKTEHKPKAQKKKTIQKKNTRGKTKPSSDRVLMDKLDKFITDRNRIF